MRRFVIGPSHRRMTRAEWMLLDHLLRLHARESRVEIEDEMFRLGVGSEKSLLLTKPMFHGRTLLRDLSGLTES